MARRRFRTFIFSATIVLFLLYRVSQNSWENPRQGVVAPISHNDLHNGQGFAAEQHLSGHTTHPDLNHAEPEEEPRPARGSFSKEPIYPPANLAQAGEWQHLETAPEIAPPDDVQEDALARDRQGIVPAKDSHGAVPTREAHEAAPTKEAHGGISSLNETVKTKETPRPIGSNGQTHQVEPVGVAAPQAALTPTKTSHNNHGGGSGGPDKVHWKPVEEHFPLPPASIRPLPKISKSINIPKIQFVLNKPEPEAARSTRLERLGLVKQEIKRAWSGYREHAWLHDELSPVSGRHRDPFCGWAATLVDSLDTLWLAGLHDEFHKAAHAVKDIDFTWSLQESIPVFETTIRYLGGLLGAVDVSGGLEGDYAFLLDKAVELADILMGVFDTPNRMPILYYRWKPDYASQPHQAGFAGMAELGTLSLEFTRLAQLTKEPKYFDAVDRITDALVEMQKDGTAIPGLFPEKLDASGCDRSLKPDNIVLSPKAQGQMNSPELSRPAVGYFPDKVATEVSDPGPRVLRRDGSGSAEAGEPASPRQIPQPQVPTSKMRIVSPPLAANGAVSEWDCVHRGLVPAPNMPQDFHIGGSQDSAYEYFQKQFLLLGGAEEKYEKLHLDSIKAIDKWLLYRPMIEGDHDIFFSARISTNGNLDRDMRKSFGIDHLSCFIGGMYAMSGKLFEQEKDLETAARLTDGCVWAYGVTPSGLMPENAHVVPCPNLDKCEFNETSWWEVLDPSEAWRTQMVAAWDEQYGTPEGEVTWEDQETDEVGLKAGESKKDEAGGKNEAGSKDEGKKIEKDEKEEEEEDGSELPQALKDRIGWSQKSSTKDQHARSPRQEEQEEGGGKLNEEGQHASDKQRRQLNSVLEANRLPPLPPPHIDPPTTPPPRPLTHEEYVKDKIKSNKMPPGFISLDDARYILRPEAIESVFYMYRTTGDPSWQDKGWAMFQATIRATRTDIAHSAVDDVFKSTPAPKDEMESFWLAETLKYYFLLFSDPDLASLDEFVFNTEAHPFRRPSA